MRSKRLLVLTVVFGPLLSAGGSATAQGAPQMDDGKTKSAAPQLVQLVQEVSDALVRVDTSKAAQLWTDDFTYIHSKRQSAIETSVPG